MLRAVKLLNFGLPGSMNLLTFSLPKTIREVASRLWVAGKQIIARPMLLVDAIRKADLKALYIPDRKRILIDSDLPVLKHRWNEAHEIGHSIIPWHKSTMLGDDKVTLSQACTAHTESEANYAAGRLLFLRDVFSDQSNDSAPTLALVRELKKEFGNTMTSTLWRMVEMSHKTIFGAVSCHPQRLSEEFDPSEPLRYFIRSPKFLKRFSLIDESIIWAHMRSYCSSAKGGPLGTEEVVLIDDNGDSHIFRMETFYNSYEALTMGVHLRACPVIASA
jgi:hypothetical protein